MAHNTETSPMAWNMLQQFDDALVRAQISNEAPTKALRGVGHLSSPKDGLRV